MKKIIYFITCAALVIISISVFNNDKGNNEEKDLVEKLFQDELILTDEKNNNITKQFKQENNEKFKNEKYHEIFLEMMKYDVTELFDKDGNSLQIGK